MKAYRPPSARRLIRAIEDTKDRGRRGLMSWATMRAHVRALLDQAAALGVSEAVRKGLRKS